MWEKNNNIQLIGSLVGEILLSHEIYDENFYKFIMKVKRSSGNFDELPITISEKLLKYFPTIIENIKIGGQIRSYNNYNSDNGQTKLVLTVFAQYTNFYNTTKDSEIYEDKDTYEQYCDNCKTENINQVYLNGYICKTPIYRTTPFGREITDILLAVNRAYKKSDYIPCITWGRNAKFASKLKPGDNIEIIGRMQSRIYQKRTELGETVEKIAYEISASQVNKIL
jgi:single-stranded DNA-binding protein